MYRSITIEPVLNGFEVIVGCQKIVFTSLNDLLAILRAYYEHPSETEKDVLSTPHAQHVCPTPPLATSSCAYPAPSATVGSGTRLLNSDTK